MTLARMVVDLAGTGAGADTGAVFQAERRRRERLIAASPGRIAASSALLADAVTRPPELAYDLGCGPGYTTAMVGEVTQASRVVGADSSAAFVAASRARHEQARDPLRRTHQGRQAGGPGWASRISRNTVRPRRCLVRPRW